MEYELTRKDYLDGKCTHDEYYGQFVTKPLILVVAKMIGAGNIAASTDLHFNDIPLVRWDNLAQITVANMAKAGDVAPTSLCSVVCVCKRAAVEIRRGRPEKL